VGDGGTREMGRWGDGEISFPLCPCTQCSMPNAQCPMPNAQCPMPYALCPMLHSSYPLISFNKITVKKSKNMSKYTQ